MKATKSLTVCCMFFLESPTLSKVKFRRLSCWCFFWTFSSYFCSFYNNFTLPKLQNCLPQYKISLFFYLFIFIFFKHVFCSIVVKLCYLFCSIILWTLWSWALKRINLRILGFELLLKYVEKKTEIWICSIVFIL